MEDVSSDMPSTVCLPQGTQGCLCGALLGMNEGRWQIQDSWQSRLLETQTFG